MRSEWAALPVLIAPAANDAGFEPNRSFLPATTPRGQRESFEREFTAAHNSKPRTQASITRYRSLIARQPGFAETHYRLARLLEREGPGTRPINTTSWPETAMAIRWRCLSSFQEAYREVAARHDCVLIDVQSYFHAIGRHGLLDDELFQDAMHPSLRGQIAIAQAVLQALHARRTFGWPAQSPLPVIDPPECVDHFGLGAAAWRVICLWGIKFNGLAAPLRFDPSRRFQARETYAVAADRIAAGDAPESVGLPNIGIPTAVPTGP